MNNSRTKRTEYLSARCTSEEKKQIENHIAKSGKNKSQYIVDCCMAAKERKSEVLRKCLVSKIMIMEQINKINGLMNDYRNDKTELNIEELHKQIERLGGMI